MDLGLYWEHDVSRKVAAWTRQPDPALLKKLTKTPNLKACPVFCPRATKLSRPPKRAAGSTA